ncbi:MAG: GNAT family N-acetyltransferase [Chitinophagales bacterium]
MLRFTAFTSNHYQAASKLWAQTAALATTLGDSEKEITRYLMRNPGCSFVCLNEHGDLLGTVLGGHDGRRGFLYHLAVREEHRHLGIAKKLISLSLDQLRNIGIERCMLMVKTENDTAQQFWKKQGWEFRDDLKMFSLNLA